MPGIGPTLPPHLTSKRKREDEDGDESNGNDTSGSPATILNNIKIKNARIVGPSLPSPDSAQRTGPPDAIIQSDADEIEPQLSQHIHTSDDGSGLPITSNIANSSQAKSKIFGPALPSVEAVQEPTATAGDDEESDDDDFGPTLPGKAAGKIPAYTDSAQEAESTQTLPKSGRDDWMLAPPTSSDWTSRIDPSKLKNRGFNTGKGTRAAPSSGGDASLWTETPEQKRKRLEDEMLGTKKFHQTESNNPVSAKRGAEDAEMAKKVQAYNVCLLVLYSYTCFTDLRRNDIVLHLCMLQKRLT